MPPPSVSATIGSDHRKTPEFSHQITQAATNSELGLVSVAIEVSIAVKIDFVTEYAFQTPHCEPWSGAIDTADAKAPPAQAGATQQRVTSAKDDAGQADSPGDDQGAAWPER